MQTRTDVATALFAFALLSLGCMGITSILTGFLGFSRAASAGLDPSTLPLAELLTPRLLGLSALIQTAGLGLIAAFLASSFEGGTISNLGLAPLSRPRVAVAAGIGSLSVGWFAGWIGQIISDILPQNTESTLDLMVAVLSQDDPFGRGLFIIAICLSAPLGEELAFRGFLWSQLSRVFPAWGVWLLTSGLFAFYHLDPVQSPALLPTALFLGWLRWRGGSVWYSVLGHVLNNLLASILILSSLHSSSPYRISIQAAILGGMLSLFAAGLAWTGVGLSKRSLE